MNEFGFTLALIGIEIIFSLMVLLALRHAGLKITAMSMLGIVLALWLVSDYLLLINGFFGATGMPRLAFTLGIVVPTVTWLVATRIWRPLREAVEAMQPSSFLQLQYMRAVFGVMFFFASDLPTWFQYIGGLGDVAAGVGAFLAIRYFQRHPDETRRAIIRGNLIGILDFVIVLNLGVFVVLRDHSPDIMFNLIPLYVVPIFILLHLFSLLQLRQTSTKVAGRPSPILEPHRTI